LEDDMRTSRLFIAAGLAAGLAGCNTLTTPADEDYQPGDLTGSVLDLQARYCANAEPAQRALAIAALEAAQVPVPDRGACTDVLDLVDADSLDPLDEVDVEAAEQDQKEARERLEEAEE
jgi:hypothetical protein